MLPGLHDRHVDAGQLPRLLLQRADQPATVHLDVAYEPMNGTVAWPSTEPITTRATHRRGRANGRSAEPRDVRRARTLTWTTRSQTSAGTWSSARRRSRRRVWTTTSTPPNSRVAASKARSTSSASDDVRDRHQGAAAPARRAPHAAPRAGRRSREEDQAGPAPAKSRNVAAPMPPVAPVTRTTGGRSGGEAPVTASGRP